MLGSVAVGQRTPSVMQLQQVMPHVPLMRAVQNAITLYFSFPIFLSFLLIAIALPVPLPVDEEPLF